MLTPTSTPIENFQDSIKPQAEYGLFDVRLEIPDQRTAVFTAKTKGPPGSNAWVRAWISNESDGTLAESEVGNIPAGNEVKLTVVLKWESTPELACIRIESERLASKHTVHTELGSIS